MSFNVARLFQWQSTNTLTREGDYLRGQFDTILGIALFMVVPY